MCCVLQASRQRGSGASHPSSFQGAHRTCSSALTSAWPRPRWLQTRIECCVPCSCARLSSWRAALGWARPALWAPLLVPQVGLLQIEMLLHQAHLCTSPTVAANALRVLCALQLHKAVLLQADPGVCKTNLVGASARASGGLCLCLAPSRAG